jgi:sporulation protein YlmC with PRC-barrel domain
MANTRDPNTTVTGTTGSSTAGTSSAGMVGSARGEGATILGGGSRTGNEGPGPRLMTASTLEGDDIVNRQGDTLGELEEIMLDVSTGRIAYAVMSAGGFLGMGDKLFAIPWSALTLDPENHCFILDADKARFENAPGFDKDHWPSMADTTWANEVHSYYGQRPYWE